MTDPAGPSPSSADAFRWQALFQRAVEPVFILNRQRRFLFVNRAWERLTGMSAIEARGLACLRRSPGSQDPWDVVVRSLCCPPPEVWRGQSGRSRRLATGPGKDRRWWDLDFLPLHDDAGLLCVLGKVTVPDRSCPESPAASAALADRLAALHGVLAAKLPDAEKDRLWRPDKLLALRDRLFERHSLDRLTRGVPALQRVADQVRLASQTRAPVLIVGEPGTGKRWLARTIHATGPTREQTLLALACGSLPPAVVTETLTGDNLAGVGSLYLEEPARLPLDVQAWLRTRLDDAGPRILAGCSSNPAEDVAAGRLLEELYWALGTLVLQLPPLRERGADLAYLVEQFLERLNTDGEHPVVGLTDAAWEVVRAYRWPGNLRELYRVLATARLHATADHIDAADLPAPLRLAVGLESGASPRAEKALALDPLLEEVERRLIRLALERARGNKTRAAELLSVWRPRLLRRMEALGIASADEEAARKAAPAPEEGPEEEAGK